MLTKNDIAATDWNTLRDTQYLVGLATLVSGSSGLGTIREAIALAQGIMENQSSEVPFIRDLTSRPEMQASQSAMRQRLGGPEASPAPDRLQRLALDHVLSSLSILKTKATAEETQAYKKLIFGLAENVANAAKEGGFMGFGGTRVSAGEQTFLDQLQDTLQLERVKRA